MRAVQHQTITHLRVNGDRLYDDFMALSQIGRTTETGICRLALSMEDLEARAWFANRIEEAGFFVQDDDAGNLSGVYRSQRPSARTLLIGSHLDTVANAGRFDGTIGVLAALECLRTIKDSGIDLPVNLEVIDFTDDEGAWEPMFGSLSLTGRLQPTYMKEGNGERSAFRAALIRAGINPDHVHRARRDPATIAGYLEMHIEQGWRLERSNVDVGVVTSIVGRSAYRITFQGQTGHAGTASMRERKDALQGAARFINRAHELICEQYPDGVLNCGNLEVVPGAITVIPSEAHISLECRHVNAALLDEMERTLVTLAETCAAEMGLTVSARRVSHMPAALLAYDLITHIEQACDGLGVSHMRIASYASHNGQVMSSFVPSGMLFIPSVGGISHNPLENSDWEDVVNGANVLLHAILNVALREPN